MPQIHLQPVDGGEGDYVVHDHVFVKSTGWVKAYDDGDNQEPVMYPPHRIRRLVGDVTHNSSHGSI